MKINCHKIMIEYVFNRVMEDYERKKNKMEQNGIERKKKEEIKECQLKIMKNRAQYSSCKLKKVEGKGEVQWLFWKDKEIGEYIGRDSSAQPWSSFDITYSNGNRSIC